MAGVYIHIPFCRRICSYCDFYHSASLSRGDALFSSLLVEIEQRKGYLGDLRPTTLYFGGGTPTVYSPERLGELARRACQVFGIERIEEFTVEANPEDLSREYLLGLKEIGVNRLSIGVQSLDDEVLRFMNRSHTAGEALAAVERARSVGFDNISVDLIFGVPGLSESSLRGQLERIVGIGAMHLSAYHLTIDHGSILYKKLQLGRFKQVDDTTSERHYSIVHEALERGGYRHYEVSNYAIPGREAVHNSGYWSGEPYVGIGPSAHSFDGVSRRANVASIGEYIGALESGESYFETEELSTVDRANEVVMTSLRRASGIDLVRFKQRFGRSMAGELLRSAEPLIRSGKLHHTGDRLYIDSRDFLISDALISELFFV